MKTATILPVWLDREDYYNKTIKFLNYYHQPKIIEALGILPEDIWLIDNASNTNKVYQIATMFPKVKFKCYNKHYARTAHLEYPFCWRCLYFARELFQEHDYTKIIHLNNDVFIISEKLANHIRDFKSGWWTPWCKKHSFPECDLQVITADCKDYWQVTAPPYLSYNGKHMEYEIKATADKSFEGDRYAEYGINTQCDLWDFACQVRLDMEIKYNV